MSVTNEPASEPLHIYVKKLSAAEQEGNSLNGFSDFRTEKGQDLAVAGLFVASSLDRSLALSQTTGVPRSYDPSPPLPRTTVGP